MLSNEIIEIAKQAGFSFWQNEEWGPGPNNIDWSADYSEEFELFVKLLDQARKKKTDYVRLSRKEVKKLNKLMKKCELADSVRLEFDHSSGIGATVIAWPDGYLATDITDVGSW